MSSDGTLRWVIAIVLTAIFTALQVQQSLRLGLLALPPVADGVVYFVDGARLLGRFHESGIGAAFSAFFGNPPHSPLSTGLAAFGFSLFGIRPWAGAVANGLVLFLFVRLFLHVARPLPLGQATLLTLALLGYPLIGHTIMDFRPDMICSLIIGVGVLFIILRDSWLYSRRDQIIAGIIFSAALWAKPSIFHLTIALYASAILLAGSVAVAYGRTKPVEVASAAGITFGIGILLAVPYYFLRLSYIANYIVGVTFGPQASVWAPSRSVQQNLLFYLTGLYGGQSIGAWLYAGVLLFACVLVVAWRTNDRTLLRKSILAAVMVLVAYVLVTAPALKGPHGFPFAAIFLVAMALACVVLTQSLGRLLGASFCVGLVIFSAWQFKWDYQVAYPGTVVTPQFAESRWEIVHQALKILGPEAAGKTVLQSTPQRYFNPTLLAFEYLARGLVPPVGQHAQVLNDSNLVRQQIAAAEFILAVTPDAKEVHRHLPSSSPDFRARIIALTEASGLFAPPVRISDPVQGGGVLVYTRLKAPSVGTK